MSSIKNRFTLLFVLLLFTLKGISQEVKKDSVLLVFNNESIVKPFEDFSRIDSLLPIYRDDYAYSIDFLKVSFDTSEYDFYETRYPFGKGNTYSYEDGSDYYLIGDVHFIISKETEKIHSVFATWQLIGKYDSLVNTKEYACELIRRVSLDALPALKNIAKCEDNWSYELESKRIYQRIELVAPEPYEGTSLEPIYFVQYEAYFD